MLSEDEKIEIAIFHTRVKYDNKYNIELKSRMIQRWTKINFKDVEDEVADYMKSLVIIEHKVMSLVDNSNLI